MVTQSAQVISSGNVNDESDHEAEEIEQQSIHLKDAEAQTDEATASVVDVLKEQLADCHKIKDCHKVKVSCQHWRSEKRAIANVRILTH